VPEYIGQGFLYVKSESDSAYDSSPSLTRVPFYSEHVTATDWRVNDSTGFPLRKVVHLNPENYSSLSMATAVAIERGLQNVHEENGYRHHYSFVLDHLKSLCPQAATSLVQHDCYLSLNGIEGLDRETALILADHKGSLSLDGLETLEPEIARLLAAHIGPLHLNGLKTLSSGATLALAPHTDTLYLDRIEKMDADTGRALAKHRGPVVLRGITNLNDEIEEHLGPRADISFGKLTGLTPRAAASLALRSGSLNLNFIQTISPEVARALSSQQGTLTLNGIAELSFEVAEALARHGGTLSLDGIKELSPKVAGAFAQHQGNLSFNEITTLNPAAAKHLSKHRGVLFLDGITNLGNEASEALLGNSRTNEPRGSYWGGDSWNAMVAWERNPRGRDRYWCPRNDSNYLYPLILAAGKSPLIDLHGGVLTKEISKLITNAASATFVRSCSSVSKDALEALANYRGALVLDGSSLSLSSEDADNLANYPGKLFLPDYAWKNLDGPRAKLLRKISASDKLDLKQVESVNDEALLIISKHPGGVFDHPALHHFWEGMHLLEDPAKAKLIAAFPKRAGNLQRIALGGVRDITEQCAEMLSATKAPLYLNALEDPSSKVFRYLAQHRGLLSLGGLRHLSGENALPLANHRGPLLLNKVQFLTSEALNLLSNHMGMLSLNGITHLNEGCAEIISAMIAPVSLKGLTEISDHDAKLLAQKSGYRVRCQATVDEKIQRTKEGPCQGTPQPQCTP